MVWNWDPRGPPGHGGEFGFYAVTLGSHEKV